MNGTQFGSRRDRLNKDQVAKLQAAGTLVDDPRRRRPYYFDGRFLTARDLVRDQQYFLTRQQDVGRAIGWGVIDGLRVDVVPQRTTTLRIEPGLGITPRGETVVLDAPWQVSTVDAAETQRLDAAFGLNGRPRATLPNPTGVFIVALRPVEYTANPVPSYPTEIGGERTIEDGDIIDALAVTLVPYAGAEDAGNEDRRRSRLARSVFLDDAAPQVPAGALPLGVVSLDRGFVRWVDNFLVRRELVGASSDLLEVHAAPRGQREAYFAQHDEHLRELLARIPARRFTAADFFDALPPVGRMPAAAITAADFTQTWFPGEIEADLSLIADDELPALIEEALLLPPIDLRLSAAELESTSVRVFLPVPRPRLREVRLTLTTVTRTLRPAAVNLLARRRPIEALTRLRLKPVPVEPDVGENLQDAAWRKLLAAADLLWYARRHNVN